jgi:hypothetical protein
VKRIHVAVVAGLAAVSVAAAGRAPAQTLAPDIVVTKTTNAPVADVRKARTTPEGIESSFAPK